VREQREEGGGCKCGWEWRNREKWKGIVNVGGNGGTEGKGGICKCDWEWGNRGKRYRDVKVGGKAGTEG
jgi:hypothetical protein